MGSLRFPIGQFNAIENPTEEQREQFIKSIADIPDKLRQAIDGLVETSILLLEALI